MPLATATVHDSGAVVARRCVVSAYDFVQFLHVLAAATWFGAGVALSALLWRLRVAGDAVAMKAVGAQIEAIGSRLFGPAAVATLVFGIVTVLLSRGGVAFTDLWVIIGIVGVVASGVLAGAYGAKIQKRIATLEADPAPDQAQLDALRRQSERFGLMDLGVLAIVMWAMVAKPTLGAS